MTIKVIGIYPPKEHVLNWFNTLTKDVEIFLKTEGKAILIDEFEKTSAGWEHPPRYEHYYRRGFNEMYVHVYPSGRYAQRWIGVSHGVRDRVIRPRRAKLLKFQEKRTPHTRPGGRWGRTSGGRRYGPTWYARAVHWPGIEPREFEEWIVKRRQTEIGMALTALTRSK